MTVIIDGVEYVPRCEVKPVTARRLKAALKELTSIQYFCSETHKHRAWAWDALNALAPNLAQLPPKEAWDFVRMGEE